MIFIFEDESNEFLFFFFFHPLAEIKEDQPRFLVRIRRVFFFFLKSFSNRPEEGKRINRRKLYLFSSIRKNVTRDIRRGGGRGMGK